MNRTLYIEHTIRLLKLYVNSDDYKTSFFILLNALKNIKEDDFIMLNDAFIINENVKKEDECEKN